jgi:hypothetical protein
MILIYVWVNFLFGFLVAKLIERRKYMSAGVITVVIVLVGIATEVIVDFLLSHRYGYGGYYGRF